MPRAEAEATPGLGVGSGQRLALLAHVARNASEGIHEGIFGGTDLVDRDAWATSEAFVPGKLLGQSKARDTAFCLRLGCVSLHERRAKMSRRQTITYSSQVGGRAPSHTYYLATTHDIVGFYCFDEPGEDGSTPYTVIDQLDRSRLLGAGSKETAKIWARRLGLSSHIYVRV